jgi:hypothetical protein
MSYTVYVIKLKELFYLYEKDDETNQKMTDEIFLKKLLITFSFTYFTARLEMIDLQLFEQTST